MPPKATKPKTPRPRPAALPDVLTLAEAAAYLRVSQEGLRADAEADRVPGRLVAGEWRFSRAAVLEWLALPNGGSSLNCELIGQGVVKKGTPSLNAGLLFSMGAFATDDSLESMVDEIYRERKRHTVGE